MTKKLLFCLAVMLSAASSPKAHGDLIFSFGESTPGSTTVQEGVGGSVVIGVFAQLDDLGDLSFNTFDSFNLFIDIGGNGVGLPDAGMSFGSPDVIAGSVFTNAATNPSNNFTIPVANADIHVSADRDAASFTTTPTKLFDLILDIDASVADGDYAVDFRDDSNALMEVNLGVVGGGVDKLLETNPGGFTFQTGSFTVSAVPEPSSLAMFVIGAAVLVRRRRRGWAQQ